VAEFKANTCPGTRAMIRSTDLGTTKSPPLLIRGVGTSNYYLL